MDYEYVDITPLIYIDPNIVYNDENALFDNIILSREQFRLCVSFLSGLYYSAYIGGRAGSGKSTCLRYCINTLKSYYQSCDEYEYYTTIYGQPSERSHIIYQFSIDEFWMYKVAVTGTTGVSAIAVNGQTLHSLLNLNEDAQSIESLLESTSEVKTYRIEKLDVLIIEEVSMLSASTFALTDILFRAIRESDLPFGGVRLLLFGDFNQLPPVIKENRINKQLIICKNENDRDLLFETLTQEYCFETQTWKLYIDLMVELMVIKRQAFIEEEEGNELSEEDIQFNRGQQIFIEFCEQLRNGKMDLNTVKRVIVPRILRNIKDPNKFAKSIDPSHINEDTTAIFSTNKQVNDINSLMESKLITDGYQYECTDHLTNTPLIDYQNDRNCPFQKDIVLQRGTKVMLLTNLDISASLVNGSQGWVIDFNKHLGTGFINALVYIPGNKRIIRQGKEMPPPVKYPFNESDKKIINTYLDTYKDYTVEIPIQYWSFKDRFTGNSIVFRLQIPLRPCYGLTVQKSQGSTFNTTLIVPAMMNKHTGLLYTAFTRNTRYNGFSIYDEDFVEDYFNCTTSNERERVINRFCLEVFSPKVSPKVINFNNILRESTKRFIEMSEELENFNENDEHVQEEEDL